MVLNTKARHNKNMKRKILFTFIPAIVLGLIISCAGTENDESNNDKTESSTPAAEHTGYVTWYAESEATSTSVAYYTPELEPGWFHCAVSEPKYNDFPAGTAIELSANGKTVHLLVTDLCPNSSNFHHTSKANYFFDLQKSAFTKLADESVGELQMTFKVIPYPTSKNIGFISTATEEWYLQGRFYNMRYPLKNVEYSLDEGKTFSQMTPVARIENNLYCINGIKIPSKAIFRLTDIYNHSFTTKEISIPSKDKKADLGNNFS